MHIRGLIQDRAQTIGVETRAPQKKASRKRRAGGNFNTIKIKFLLSKTCGIHTKEYTYMPPSVAYMTKQAIPEMES